MNQKFTRWTAIAALAIAGALPLVVHSVHGQEQPPAAAGPAVASLEQLKTEAFLALRDGNFDRGNDLLAKAAEQSNDRTLGQMHQWTAAFEGQLKRFADERHAAYAKAMVDVKTMRQADHPDAALDLATRAQLLSDNKTEFHNLPWMRSLIADAVTRAGKYESADDWFKAMQVYEDLAAVEPASRDWKEKLKSVTRRVRLLSTYAPEVSKKALEKYLEDRKATDALLAPATTRPSTTAPSDALAAGTTRPTTGPSVATGATTKPAVDPLVNAEAFKTDWHDTLKGVQLQQLTTALSDIYTNYYRDVTYRQLLGGGIEGLQAILTTPGLETAFPGLADPAKRDAFSRYLADWRAMATNATADNEQALIDQFLSADDKDGLMAVNARTVGVPNAVLINEFFDGAHSGLDPFTDMIWPSLSAEFRKQTQGSFSGVGIQIESDNGDLTVVEPLPDSPAEAAGVNGGDVIAMINGQSAKDVTTEQAVHLITGPTGTMVRLTLRSPDGKSRDVNLRRRKIQVSSIKGYTEVGTGKWSYWIDPDSHIAYVRILSFTQGTPTELRAVLNELGEQCNGLILDLRGNPGGLLPAAIGVCDTFLKSGDIVSTHPDRDTPNLPFTAVANDDGDEFTKPLVVLINQYSASASEIVSGALKDDHRAILVGERTYGKGSVQQLFPLPPDDDCTIKLTTSHYYLPSGRCIHREENSTTWGVDPDVTVELTPEQMQATLIARHKMDVFHAVTTASGGSEGDAKLRDTAAAVTEAQKGSAPTTNPSGVPSTQPAVVTKPTDLLDIDPQLSAAVLVMRLELAGARL
jgi:carboxyl-terminal processing protease